MANQLQTNLHLNTGTDFTHQFSMVNVDKSAVDLTGSTFTAVLAKRSGAIDALASTSAAPVYKQTAFTVAIDDATGGLYSISLDSTQTSALDEGKYVFTIVREVAGTKTRVMEGLVFVDQALSVTSIA